MTRYVVGSVLLTTVGPLLSLVSPYSFLLWWPAVLKGQIWRVFTSFCMAGSGLQLLFDVFMLGRNMLDLETNHFYRNTADFTWALAVIGSLIAALNYPLRATVLFRPLLSAVSYLWARTNPTSSVSLFGVVTVPALLLPYVYLGFDLLQGGIPLVIHSGTGLIAAHVYWYFTAIRPGAGGRSNHQTGPLATPAFLRRLLPPSIDPSVPGGGGTGQPGADDPTNARRMLNTGWGGTAFAPRGRDFNDGRADWAGSAGTGQSIGGGGRAASSSSSWTSWLPFGRGGTSSSSQPAASSSSSSREKQRQDRLDALERRLQSQRDNSIAGRNAAAANANAAAPPSQQSAGRATGPGTTGVNARSGSGATSSSSSMRARAAVDASGSQEKGESESEPLLDASSSGGTVAEQRRHDGDDAHKGKQKQKDEDAGHQWGGSGRRLGE